MFTQKLWKFAGGDTTLRKGNLVASDIIAGSNGTTGIASAEGDYQNRGVNLDYIGNYLANVANQTPISKVFAMGDVNLNGVVSDPSTTKEPWEIANGELGEWVIQAIYKNIRVVFDIGAQTNLSGINITPETSSTYDLEWSTDNFLWNTITSNNPSSGVIPFTATARYIGYTYRNSGGLFGGFSIFRILEEVIASTDNTADGKMVVVAPEIFTPSSLVVRDDVGAIVSDASVNAIEVVDGTPGNGGTLVTLDTFRLRPNLASSANVQVRVQPVGAQRIGSVSMTSIATNTAITASNFVQQVAGAAMLLLDGLGGIFQVNRTTPATPVDGVTVFSEGDVLKYVDPAGDVANVSKDPIALSNPVDTTSRTLVPFTDGNILADCTAGNLTYTLPAAASNTGVRFFVKRFDSSTNYVDVATTDQIDSSTASYRLGRQNERVEVESNGVNWFVRQSRDTAFAALIADNTATQTVAVADTFEKYLGFTASGQISTPGRLTADGANDKIVINHFNGPTTDGYDVKGVISFEHTNNSTVTFQWYDVAQATLVGSPSSATGLGAGEPVSVNLASNFTVSALGDLELYYKTGTVNSLDTLSGQILIRRFP